ncbi:MAG: DUF1501 domain-containing protein, partial [Verrucomicrobiota bacterium]
MKTACHVHQMAFSRRGMLRASAGGFGAIALSTIASAANGTPQHFSPRAKRCIFLFMHGGVSQIDSFDPKPRLNTDHGKPLPFKLPGLIRPDRLGKVFGSKWKFARHGESGQPVSELFPCLAKQVDKMSIIKSMHTDGEAHGQAILRLHTGEANFVRPSIGSWISYGLQSENDSLPGFVSIDYPSMHGGVRLYGNSFLPAKHQGTQIRVRTSSKRLPQVRHLKSDLLSTSRQRELIDAVQALNRSHYSHSGGDPQLEGVIDSFELAYRMQRVAPELMDIESEPQHIKDLYGVDGTWTDGYARQCILARRMAEAGVRFIQVATDYHWDHHGNIDSDLPKSAAKTDQPVAALLADLDQRGLLDETLVVWAGEFGRTPVAQIDRGNPGRDHNPHGFTVFLAGGGVKQGFALGETDEFGYLAIKDKVHMHDLHAT